ncbi:MAG: rhomboid family intramembrane serine protease [Candidatus Eremiobacteraeota bacterium]|nr:rhomboid family intramembrane serine protease [Candidatus Eremiobacteraeota bacterium]MBC5826700.1 rhomboid family intramembrane serine protease [Candidatus Eremiobacteraeota bacterium]
MIPYRDENRVSGFPLMTYFLIGVNIIVFFHELALGTDQPAALDHYFAALGLVPYDISHHIQHVAAPHPEFLTLVTALFLHAGFLHVAGNMLYLFIFGPDIEYLTGPFRFAVFYIACGVAAGYAQVVAYPDSHVVAIGASGAIAGALGAFVLFFGGNRIDTVLPIGCFPLFLQVPALVVIGIWIVLQVTLIKTETGSTGGVGYLEHVSGFVAGMLLIFALKVRTAPRAWTA